MFSHEHLSFLQTLPFHQFSSLIMLTILLSGGQTREVWEPTNKKKSLRMRGFRRNQHVRLSGMLTRRLLVVTCRRFGTLCPNFKNQADWLLQIEPIKCAETPTANYQTTLCNIPEERRRPVRRRRVVGRKIVWHWFVSLQDGQVAKDAAARCWLLFCPAYKLIMLCQRSDAVTWEHRARVQHVTLITSRIKGCVPLSRPCVLYRLWSLGTEHGAVSSPRKISASIFCAFLSKLFRNIGHN